MGSNPNVLNSTEHQYALYLALDAHPSLRRVLEVASTSDAPELQMSGELATGTLAIVLARQGRQAEAQEMINKVIKGTGPALNPMMDALVHLLSQHCFALKSYYSTMSLICHIT